MPDQNYLLSKQNSSLRLTIKPSLAAGEKSDKVETIDLDLTKLSLPKAEQDVISSRLVLKVPDSIPGIAKISKAVEPQNPEARIFIIKNIHGSNHCYMNLHEIACSIKGSAILDAETKSLVRDITKNQVSIVNNNLEKTIKALDYFTQSHAIKSFYLEGKSVESFISNPIARSLEFTSDKPQAKPIGMPADAKEIWQRLAQMKPSTKDEMKNYLELRQNAVILENMDFPLGDDISKRLPPEITQLPTESEKLVNLTNLANRNDLVLNCREDLVIELVDHLERNGDKVAVIVFGGGHDFSDNIERFNNVNNRQLALTVLEPDNYTEDSDKVYQHIVKLFEKLGVKVPIEFKALIKEKFGG